MPRRLLKVGERRAIRGSIGALDLVGQKLFDIAMKYDLDDVEPIHICVEELEEIVNRLRQYSGDE